MDLEWVRRDSTDPIVYKHFEVTSEAGLLGCLDDLAEIFLAQD